VIVTSALSEVGALSPSLATGIAILSAVATLLGGILTGALLLWRFSSLITAMKATSETGHKETTKAIETLSEKTAAAIDHLSDQTSQSIEAIEKNLGAQIAELKSDRRDQEENVRRLEVNVSKLEGSIQRAWVEIDALRMQTGSLQRIAAQREK
jgi:polyhydroxyalkanoate synthesis regulator phasin